MSKKAMVLVLAGAAALIGTVAVAGVAASHKEERAKQFITWKLDDALDELDATPQQRDLAQSLKDQLFDEGLKLKAQHEAAREELMKQWRSDRVDAARVHGVVDEMADGIRAFAHKAADAAISFHDALTPKQREQAVQKMEAHRQHWGR